MNSRKDKVKVSGKQYVSRGGHKLESVADKFKVDFRDKIVLDIGSSTGGFTDFALKHGAKKVIAIDVGTDQLHPSLRRDKRIELHEKTDIRDVQKLSDSPDYVVMDLSFISLREVMPHILKLIDKECIVIALAKPQFESGAKSKNRGVIKNKTIRRKILSDLEQYLSRHFFIADKADSAVLGSQGNQERFYKLTKL